MSELEWTVIARYLEQNLPQEASDSLHGFVAEAYGPHREALEALADYMGSNEHGLAPIEGIPARCPFLDASGCCGIYPVRPMVCRTYGFFGTVVERKLVMLICQKHGPDFINLMTEKGEKPLTLPQFDPINEKLRAIAGLSRVAPLPLWLLRWREGQFRST